MPQSRIERTTSGFNASESGGSGGERRFRSELRFKLWLRLGRYNIIISRLYVVFITLLNIHRAIISY